jgi:hypothetical protein
MIPAQAAAGVAIPLPAQDSQHCTPRNMQLEARALLQH